MCGLLRRRWDLCWPPSGWLAGCAQGIETVRRDNCLLVRNVVTTCLERILIAKDVPGAVAYVKGVISELLMNKIDLSLLVISKVGPSLDPACLGGALWAPGREGLGRDGLGGREGRVPADGRGGRVHAEGGRTRATASSRS